MRRLDNSGERKRREQSVTGDTIEDKNDLLASGLTGRDDRQMHSSELQRNSTRWRGTMGDRAVAVANIMADGTISALKARRSVL